MSDVPTPPGFLIRRIERALPEVDRRVVLGDLLEEWHRRRQKVGLLAANRWLSGQAVLFTLARFLPSGRPRGQAVSVDTDPTDERPGYLGLDRRTLAITLRRIGRRPLASALIIGTMAVAIGLNALLFSLAQGVLLRDLPYTGPDQLMVPWSESDAEVTRVASPPDLMDFRDYADRLQFAGATGGSATFVDQGIAERLKGATVTSDFLPMLGVDPVLGRTISEADDIAGSENVVLLSYGLWRRRFGGDPDMIGRAITLDDAPHTVIGVLPADFRLLVPPVPLLVPPIDVVRPMRLDRSRGQRGLRYMFVLARRPADMTMAEAQAEADRIAETIAQNAPEHATDNFRLSLGDLKSEIVGDVRTGVLAVWLGVGLLLAIACVNVAALMYAQTNARRPELALRAVLGAGRRRLVAETLTEALLLAAVGGALGVVVASVAQTAFVSLTPATFPRIDQVQVDAGVLGYSFVLALLAGVVFGLAPALQAAGSASAAALRAPASRAAGHGAHRVQRVFVTLQVGIAVVLSVAAALMLRSFAAVTTFDPGYEANGVTAFELAAPRSRYPDNESVARLHQDLLDRLSALPGVASAAAGSTLPFKSEMAWVNYYTEGGEESEESNVWFNAVSNDYFETLRTTLVAGRAFDERDRIGSAPVVIVDANLAAQLWPGGDPIGRQLDLYTFVNARPFRAGRQVAEVVGVAAPARYQDLTEVRFPVIYQPLATLPFGVTSFAVRSEIGAPLSAQLLRDVVSDIDPAVPIYSVAPLSGYLGRAMAPMRFIAVVLALFAAVSVLLAAVGVYGVLSYLTSQRDREVGIRMALGASQGGVLRLVLRQAAEWLVVGTGVGALAALGFSRVLSNQLFSISADDPRSYAMATGVIFLVGVIACTGPALRAARTDPMRTLRGD